MAASASRAPARTAPANLNGRRWGQLAAAAFLTKFVIRKEVSASQHLWRGGGLMDGAPLMKFLKGKNGAGTPEEDAIASRLTAVTNRGKVEVSGYAAFEGAQHRSAPMQRLFHSPGEDGVSA